MWDTAMEQLYPCDVTVWCFSMKDAAGGQLWRCAGFGSAGRPSSSFPMAYIIKCEECQVASLDVCNSQQVDWCRCCIRGLQLQEGFIASSCAP